MYHLFSTKCYFILYTASGSWTQSLGVCVQLPLFGETLYSSVQCAQTLDWLHSPRWAIGSFWTGRKVLEGFLVQSSLLRQQGLPELCHDSVFLGSAWLLLLSPVCLLDPSLFFGFDLLYSPDYWLGLQPLSLLSCQTEVAIHNPTLTAASLKWPKYLQL